MILGPYIIGPHVVERYIERIGKYKGMTIEECIKRDLHFTKIRKIVNKKNGDTHVFTIHSKEFIFSKEKGKLVLITVIKRNRETHQKTMNRRQQQVRMAY
jgi:hypothetical protein